MHRIIPSEITKPLDLRLAGVSPAIDQQNTTPRSGHFQRHHNASRSCAYHRYIGL